MKPNTTKGLESDFEVTKDEFSRAQMGYALTGAAPDRRLERLTTSVADRGTAHAVLTGNMALLRAIDKMPGDADLADLRQAAKETVTSGVVALYGAQVAEAKAQLRGVS